MLLPNNNNSSSLYCIIIVIIISITMFKRNGYLQNRIHLEQSILELYEYRQRNTILIIKNQIICFIYHKYIYN